MLHLWDASAAEEATEGEASSDRVRSLRSTSPSTLAGPAGRARPQRVTGTLALEADAIGILGHELRNPLSAIAALARGLMHRTDLAEDAKARLLQIDRAAQRSLLMIASVLEFSEIHSHGTLPVRPVPTDPEALAATLVEEMRLAHPGQTVDLEVRRSTQFPMDPLRMGQVLSNLIGNALMHGSSSAPVHVVVDVCEREACFVVENQGPTIPAERIDSLFEPFTRGLAGEGAATQGLGLGLHIVDVVVAAHGGTVTVQSNAEAGTAFTVRLPRRPG